MASRRTAAGTRLSNNRQAGAFGEPANAMTRLTSADLWILRAAGRLPEPALHARAQAIAQTLRGAQTA